MALSSVASMWTSKLDWKLSLDAVAHYATPGDATPRTISSEGKPECKHILASSPSPFLSLCLQLRLSEVVQLCKQNRAIRAATPGPYTFILPATPEVPRRLLHPRKRTVGVRIPDHVVVQALLEALGEPLLSSTLIALPMVTAVLVKSAHLQKLI